jgi:ketosteroid isomerase-like protein
MSEHPKTPDLEALTRRIIEAGNVRDIETMIGFYTPDSVWDMSEVGLETIRGRAAIRVLFEDWMGAYEDYGQETEEVSDLGNGVTFGIFLLRGRPPGSSGWVEQRYAAIATWSDGLIEHTTNTFDIDGARAAAQQLAKSRS